MGGLEIGDGVDVIEEEGVVSPVLLFSFLSCLSRLAKKDSACSSGVDCFGGDGGCCCGVTLWLALWLTLLPLFWRASSFGDDFHHQPILPDVIVLL